MIFDLWPLPEGSHGQKKGAVAYAIHVSNSHTNSGCISEEEKKTLKPQKYLQVPPLGYDPGGRMKTPSNMFDIFHL